GSTKLEKSGMEILCCYHWPGNVRELMAIIRRIKLREAGKDVISIELVRQEIGLEKTDTPAQCTFTWHLGEPVTECLAEVLLRMYRIGIAHSEGNHSEAARFLGLDRKTLTRKLAWAHRVIDGIRD